MKVFSHNNTANIINRNPQIVDIQGLSVALDLKANTTDVNTALALKADKHIFSPTLANLTWDGALYSFFYSEISASATFSISNLVQGVLYRGEVKNTHVSASIVLTHPNTSAWVVSGKLTTVGVPVGWTQPYEIIYDGTKYRMWVGSLMKVMA